MVDLMSPEPPLFEPRRFRTAARHYLAGRPPYAARLIEDVAKFCGLSSQHRLLDLGCGPGQLAKAFAAKAGSVLGLHPEPEMLAFARQDSPPNVEWRQGSSHDLGPECGRFQLVTMGRSFHWMDRVETLRRLDGMIEPGGAVILFRDNHPDLPENAWRSEFRALLARYEEPRPAHRATNFVPHISVLLDSPFSALEEMSVIERRSTKAETLVERALSMSSTSRAHIGDRADALAMELSAWLSQRAPEGVIYEVVATTALIARRASEIK
jgi:2-polyprenyl-3-methyl-5-hydroxy-6-metoxy-1,4-benzoquinol methylase